MNQEILDQRRSAGSDEDDPRRQKTGRRDESEENQRVERVARIWQRYFDTDGNGWASFEEFSRGCTMIGFTGNVKAAFEVLDFDRKGHF